MSSFGGCMWDVNDVTVWPGSSTSPPSDPRQETVWYGLAANGLAANGLAANGLAANSLLRVCRRSDFIYTKNSAAKKSWRHGVRTHDVRIKTRFLDHLVKWVPVWTWCHFVGNITTNCKNWGGRCWWKSSFYWGKISRTWPKIQYFKKFLSRNDQILSTQRICQIYDVVKNLMGAMHQKIAIFKEENSVCRGTKFSNITKNWGGRCWWKSSFYWGKMSRTLPKIDHKMALLFRWTKFEIEKQNMSGNFEDHKMALLFRWTKFEIQNKTCHYNYW